MGITVFDDIVSVWFNEGHRVASFCLIFICLYFLILIIKYRKIFFRSSIMESVIFIINIVVFIIGLIGIGQFIFPPLLDSVVRAVGLFVVIVAIFMKSYFYRKHYNFLLSSEDYCISGFYKYVRNPNSFIDFVLLSGFGIAVVSPFSFGITIFIYIPISLILINIKEKKLIKIDENYIDYMTDVNKFIPDFKTLFKLFF